MVCSKTSQTPTGIIKQTYYENKWKQKLIHAFYERNERERDKNHWEVVHREIIISILREKYRIL